MKILSHLLPVTFSSAFLPDKKHFNVQSWDLPQKDPIGKSFMFTGSDTKTTMRGDSIPVRGGFITA